MAEAVGAVGAALGEGLAVAGCQVLVGCESGPQRLAVCRGALAYAAGHCIAISQGSGGPPYTVAETFAGHGAPVSCLCWAGSDGDEPSGWLVSGASNGTVIVWRHHCDQPGGGRLQLAQRHGFAGDGAIGCIAATLVGTAPNTVLWCAVGTSHGRLHVVAHTFLDGGGGEAERQEVDLGSGLPLAVAFGLLPELPSAPVLIVGREDGSVQLCTRAPPAGDGAAAGFRVVASLLGHEDWVRGLSCTRVGSALWLATCAQDSYIRLWRLSVTAADADSGAPCDEDEDPLASTPLTRQTFAVASRQCQAEFESLLCGHVDKVYSVAWEQRPPSSPDTTVPRLLSASLDRSVILWAQEPEHRLWSEECRLGEVKGESKGFFGAVLSPDGDRIFAHRHLGAINSWHRAEAGSPGVPWRAEPAPGGHVGKVMGMDWSADGQYLLTTGTDQTTRAFAQWDNELQQGNSGGRPTWHEAARPQVHGYDLRCMCSCGTGRFASGAEEKVLRVFEAPEQFAEILSGLAEARRDGKRRYVAASVPALGLMNKVVQDDDGQGLDIDVSVPATGQVLARSTLWPEAHKLYGHGNELLAVASTSDGRLLASSCKAAKPEHALIRLFRLDTWDETCRLPGHKLSVTRLAFSPKDDLLLSVSRDRQWCVYGRAAQDGFQYEQLAFQAKAHDRILWDCAWFGDGHAFVTASRDKMVKFWATEAAGPPSSAAEWQQAGALPKFRNSVTSLALTERPKSGTLLAVGLDDGGVEIWKRLEARHSWAPLLSLPLGQCHVGTVSSLRWRPSCEQLQLAACGHDHSVRIFDFVLAGRSATDPEP